MDKEQIIMDVGHDGQSAQDTLCIGDLCMWKVIELFCVFHRDCLSKDLGLDMTLLHYASSIGYLYKYS